MALDDKKINKITSLFAVIASFMLAILLSVLLVVDNVDVINNRENKGVTLVENYSLERVVSENSPVGIKEVYVFTLDDNLDGETLGFYTLHQYVDVYIEDELVYSATIAENNKITTTYGGDWILLPLSNADSNKRVSIIITPAYNFIIGNRLEIYVGSVANLLEMTFKTEMIPMTLGIIALFMGVLFILVAFYNWAKKERGGYIMALGIFSMLLGLWKLAGLRFMPFLDFDKPIFFLYLEYSSLIMVAPPLIWSIRSKYKNLTKRHLDRVSLIVSIVVIIEVIVQLLGLCDFRQLLTVNNGLLVAVGVVIIALSIYDRIKFKKKLISMEDRNLFIIIAGGVIDMVLFYVTKQANELVCTLMAVNIYVVLEGISLLLTYSNNEKELAKQERELIDKELTIKMSQIQPHFLYNSLTSIHYLCDKDPKLAKKAVKWFSTYLRGNLESMSKENMVPFEQELNHIEIYLKLEKLRFGEYLDVVYNIETKDFLIPSLTIQPLVENAVKHGVGDKKEGGQVIISSFEIDGYYIVTIEDTGIGFDEEKAFSDDRKHIGIENVKERLSLICNGELIIHSEINKGTVAIIRVPKDYGGGTNL